MTPIQNEEARCVQQFRWKDLNSNWMCAILCLDFAHKGSEAAWCGTVEAKEVRCTLRGLGNLDVPMFRRRKGLVMLRCQLLLLEVHRRRKHGMCVVMTLGFIDLAIDAGWVSPCLFSFAHALRRLVSSWVIRPLNALSWVSTSCCRAVSRASRVRGL